MQCSVCEMPKFLSRPGTPLLEKTDHIEDVRGEGAWAGKGERGGREME